MSTVEIKLVDVRCTVCGEVLQFAPPENVTTFAAYYDFLEKAIEPHEQTCTGPKAQSEAS